MTSWLHDDTDGLRQADGFGPPRSAVFTSLRQTLFGVLVLQNVKIYSSPSTRSFVCLKQPNLLR